MTFIERPKGRKMPQRFLFHRMDAQEFRQALEDANLSITDFQFITGRHVRDMDQYKDPNAERSPTLSEIVLLTLARDPELRRQIIEIADARMLDIGNRKDRT